MVSVQPKFNAYPVDI